jgi:glyoxylase-like metal-dependent hydrolase (beta-lactamase superfamily II)
MALFPNATILMQRAEYDWIHSPNGPNDNVNQLMALARDLLGTPKRLQLVDGDTDVFGDGSVILVATPGHTPGHQSLLVHLKNSGFIILSGDVVHLQENFAKNIVPSLNTRVDGTSQAIDRNGTGRRSSSIMTNAKPTSLSCSLDSTIEVKTRRFHDDTANLK